MREEEEEEESRAYESLGLKSCSQGRGISSKSLPSSKTVKYINHTEYFIRVGTIVKQGNIAASHNMLMWVKHRVWRLSLNASF